MFRLKVTLTFQNHFSNSLGSDLRLWDSQVETLKDQYCIIRYDTRGHGHSSKFEGPTL